MEDAVPLTKYDMEKLKSEVFWDYQITKENLIKMARSDDLRERKHLFEKILFNSTELIMKLPGIFFLMKKNRRYSSVTVLNHFLLPGWIESRLLPPYTYHKQTGTL
jgi:hypothetical protein